jgi:hypothetical protein
MRVVYLREGAAGNKGKPGMLDNERPIRHPAKQVPRAAGGLTKTVTRRDVLAST